jgi:hypothetical protein
VEDCLTLTAIFRGNVELCECVSETLIKHVVKLIEQKQRNAVFVEFLQVGHFILTPIGTEPHSEPYLL